MISGVLGCGHVFLQEINIQRGLKQGDPLAHFLFLLVAEALSMYDRKAEALGMFTCFNLGRSVYS